MMKRKTRSRLAFLTLGIGLWSASPLQAQAASSLSQLDLSAQSNLLNQPSLLSPAATEISNPTLLASRFSRFRRGRFRVRASRYRRGGFSRGSCPQQDAFMPLTPSFEEESTATGIEESTDIAISPTSPLLLPITAYATTSTHPTFFLNLPALSNAKGTLFVDNADPNASRAQRQIYKVDFDISEEAGIVGIKVPDDAPPLNPGQTYLWRLAITCAADSDRDVVLVRGGVVDRVAVDEISGSVDERLEYYTDQGLWQNLLMLTAEERYQSPESSTANQNWADLMTASGLEDLATVPIMNIITAELAR
ncbi:DUF928 domain-containing protein [cf. Phormidesmis sp. LEGE 11477]|uniref:DUF928 domain-containing protein n=1 Tax=cf. Phormidesmis sp. LEGE 11477 TaxID=1828680 RepID=UPI001882FE2B|nr:DUF928 domain-containing protein [cf. Phormidesmis sp. LEGE 11477]MBE9062396.1 DUF928 domain-containing protein [cf. Phormidesmis sp. LEGE 11477]